MSTTAALVAVFAVGFATYFWRSSLVIFLADRHVPEPIERALRNVGPAVMAALVVSLVAGDDGIAGIDGPEVIAVVAGGLAAARTRSLVWTIVVGMVALWISAWLL